ncbi:MAG: hypothetical protein ABJL54_08025 [Halioglobus sp.]
MPQSNSRQRRSWLFPLALAASGMAAVLCLPAHAATCPSEIGEGDCTSQDLQPTGTEIVNGPEACTIGETIAVDLRVKFENGGGAKERYSVGFFVGDNGESPIGGSSCTFDSLQPVGAPIDLTGGSGGFLNFDTDPIDVCGDIGKADPTYKDISLSNVLCKDDDGDGLVDIGYVLTWDNPGNRELCTDPLDPTQFEPRKPKCQSELEYDIPIDVELPPSIAVGKAANPSELREPGGAVEIVFTIFNNSPSATDPITITSIVDVPYGDLTNSTSCSLPVVIPVGDSITCTYSTVITGATAGETYPDEVTVTGEDDEGNAVEGKDNALITIIDSTEPPLPGDLRLLKLAIPAVVFEPGGFVTYEVILDNVSETPIEVSTLTDDIYGDLNGKGSCQLPVRLEGGGSLYQCGFSEFISGQPGFSVTDIITATATDDLPQRNVISASDDATVRIIDRQSNLEVKKLANPVAVQEPGGDVEYTLYIQNQSLADDIRVDSIVDSRAGGVGAACGTPFTLKPGELTLCRFSDYVSGSVGEFVTNVVVVKGVDDDGAIKIDDDAASVEIQGVAPSLQVTKLALPPFARSTGSDVKYFVRVKNNSGASDPIEVTSMEDVIQDNAGTIVDLSSTCGLPIMLLPGEQFDCTYDATLDGTMTTPQDTPLINTVTANGADDEGVAVTGSDDARVRFVSNIPTPPGIALIKSASPNSVIEPGDDVTFSVLVVNTGAIGSADITIDSLNDDIYGSLAAKGTCGSLIGASISARSFEVCSFTEFVSGPAGTSETNTIDVIASYAGGIGQLTTSDSATVEIIDLVDSLTIVKTANPTAIIEPGGEVTFSFVLTNTSPQNTITLLSLSDSIYGDLSLLGNCAIPVSLNAGEVFECSFAADVRGQGGTEELNTVTVTGLDPDGNDVQATDQATVFIEDSLPSVTASKSASPNSLPPGGGNVNFLFGVSNTSKADELTIDTLVDSVFGDLNARGTCSVPQTLKPGETYNCQITEALTGDIGDVHLNQVKAQGVSDDGVPVSANASALVRFLAAVQGIPVMGRFSLILLACALIVAVSVAKRRARG